MAVKEMEYSAQQDYPFNSYINFCNSEHKTYLSNSSQSDSGTIKRSTGEIAAIGKQLRLLNFKAVKKVTVKFDPFSENVKHARDLAHFISSPKIANTNPNCSFKTEILCNRTEPLVIFNLLPAYVETEGLEKIVLKGGNLTCLQLLQLTNKYITKLAPKEEEAPIVQTKAQKKK